MIDNDRTLTPKSIIDNYSRIVARVHGRKPEVLHLGGPWYEVDGQTVHRIAILTEIERLKPLAPPPSQPVTDRSVIHRLIAKLRGI